MTSQHGIWRRLIRRGVSNGDLHQRFLFGVESCGTAVCPFDAFDRLTRVLPGRVIAFGIAIMVSAIRALNWVQRPKQRRRPEDRKTSWGLAEKKGRSQLGQVGSEPT